MSVPEPRAATGLSLHTFARSAFTGGCGASCPVPGCSRFRGHVGHPRAHTLPSSGPPVHRDGACVCHRCHHLSSLQEPPGLPREARASLGPAPLAAPHGVGVSGFWLHETSPEGKWYESQGG